MAQQGQRHRCEDGSSLYQPRELQIGQSFGHGDAAAGVASARLSVADMLVAPAPATDRADRADFLAPLRRIRARACVLQTQAQAIDWAPDLGNNIGSATWFRGLFTLIGLCAAMAWLWPGLQPIQAATPPAPAPAQADELRSQMIMPLAFGSDTGRSMGPTDAVVRLAQSPERPQIELAAVLGPGDSFTRVLQRAGVGAGDAHNVSDLVSGVLPLDTIKRGTRFDLVLGRRYTRSAPRPVDSLAFRARFDLNVAITRENGTLVLTRKPIRVDATPLRVRGTVGSSLYRSARAAGAPAEAVQAYLQALSGRMSLSRDIGADDEFDIIIDYKRAETGEVEVGRLLYAGLVRDGKPRAQLLRWQAGGTSQFFEASGVGEERGEFARPVSGGVSSGFGVRRHPILGYRRMHSGLDFKASYGSPIYATADGVVNYAGRKGGYGNFVRIAHGGGLASGYGHMSRIAVSSGSRVRRGQIIGYVGSTGLSTGPHLHYELYRGGHAVDPRSVKFTTRAQLSGSELAAFKAKLGQLMRVAPGAALASIAAPKPAEPTREIDRIEGTTIS